jgi:phage-related minor tail protein
MADDTKVIIDSSQIDAAISKLKTLSQQYAATGTATNGATGAAKVQTSALNSVAGAANKAASAHAGVSREVVVLAHELSQGNFSRFGGSMLVLAEQTNALGTAMKALSGLGLAGGVALGGFALVAGGLAIAAHQASAEQKALAAALALTNDYAGLTMVSFHGLAEVLAGQTNTSLGKANDVLMAIAKTGLTTSENIGNMGIVVQGFAALGGEKLPEVAAKFSEINTKPAEFSREMDSMMHIFTPAQLQMVEQLEATGHTQEATTAALKVFAEYMQGPAAQAIQSQKGLLDSLAESLSKVASGFRTSFGTPQSLDEMKTKLASLQEDSVGSDADNSAIAALQAKIKAATDQAAQAKIASDKLVTDQRIKNADQYLDKFTKNSAKEKQELEELATFLKTARADPATGGKYDADFESQAKAQIERKYQPIKTPAAAGANAVQGNLQSQAGEIARLTDEINKLNGATSQTALDTLNAEIAAGKFGKALTVQSEAQLRSNAATIDAKNATLAEAKANQEAWAQAERVAKSENDKVDAARKSAAENQIARTVLAQYGKTQDDVRIAMDKYNIEQVKSQLAMAKTGAEVYELTAKLEALQKIQDIDIDTKKMDDSFKASQETFTAGWKRALDQQKADVEDTSKLSASLVDTATTQMGDSLATFAKTGKLNFDGLVNGIIDDLANWAAKELVVIGLEEIASSMANGGAWSGGTQVFADGGVVNSPTTFGMAGGRTGLMGEAGPEAIMPLTRGQDGKLGVKASGSNSGGASIRMGDINITMQGSANNPADAAALAKTVQRIAASEAAKALNTANRSGGVNDPIR